LYPYNYAQTAGIAPSFDGAAPFADPYLDVASTAMPLSIPAMLRHAEWFSVTNETFREALNKVAAYFVTDIEIEGDLGDDEKRNQKDYLKDQMRLMSSLVEASLNRLVYGNQYTSVVQPITRYLVCPKCHTQYRAAEVIQHQKRFEFEWKQAFHCKCLSCGHKGKFGGGANGGPLDLPDESRPPIIKVWNPHDIRHVYVEYLGRATKFDWVMPADVRTEIKQGTNLETLIETPWDHIQAALNDENVRFDEDYIHHSREPGLNGLRMRGWGVPRAIINFRRLFHIQILYRMNEVLALGHIVPIRVVSPKTTAGRGMEDGDILKMSFMGDLRARFNQIVANHRADPNSIHYSPTALQMDALGADAKQLIPADLIKLAQETLLNGSGVPIEFYNMSMGTQVAPVGLRLIERYWAPLVDGLNELLSFIQRRMQFLKKWEKSTYKLASVRVIDSIELNQLKVQMAQAGLMSRSSALQAVESDFRTETKKKLEDMRIEQTEQADYQQKMDAFSFGRQLAEATPVGGLSQGAPPAQGGGGDPSQQGQPAPGQAPGVPAGADPMAGIMPQPGARIDPQELESRADAAVQVLLQLDESTRFSKLQEIRKNNQLFHKIVTGKLDEKRREMRSEGQRLVQSQQYGTQS